MSPKLHQPLGLDRKRVEKPARRLSPLKAALVASVLGLAGLSLYTATVPLPLSHESQVVDRPPAAEADQQAATNQAQPSTSPGLSSSRPRSGANVETTTLADGSVVTKYSPRPRDGAGPILIDTPRIGQDPRAAAIPNEALLEDSPFGRLPVIGPDGLRPVDQYARPWSGARGTRIAIVVGGLGLSQTGTQKAIRQLPEEITLAFAATGNSLQRWMQEARQGGHEILLQVPLEPFDYPANDPGRGTLLTTDSDREGLAKLHEAMARITNYTGIMNYMGERFLSDGQALEPVMRDIGSRGLLFLDDGSSARSLSAGFAKAINMPHAFADLQLDDQLQQQAIMKRLDELERIGRRKGSAIGVASAFDETIVAVRQWALEAAARGIEIVGVSALADNAQQ